MGHVGVEKERQKNRPGELGEVGATPKLIIYLAGPCLEVAIRSHQVIAAEGDFRNPQIIRQK